MLNMLLISYFFMREEVRLNNILRSFTEAMGILRKYLHGKKFLFNSILCHNIKFGDFSADIKFIKNLKL